MDNRELDRRVAEALGKSVIRDSQGRPVVPYRQYSTDIGTAIGALEECCKVNAWTWQLERRGDFIWAAITESEGDIIAWAEKPDVSLAICYAIDAVAVAPCDTTQGAR